MLPREDRRVDRDRPAPVPDPPATYQRVFTERHSVGELDSSLGLIPGGPPTESRDAEGDGHNRILTGSVTVCGAVKLVEPCPDIRSFDGIQGWDWHAELIALPEVPTVDAGHHADIRPRDPVAAELCDQAIGRVAEPGRQLECCFVIQQTEDCLGVVDSQVRGKESG